MNAPSHSPVPPGQWPTEIRLPEDRSALLITFEDGSRFALTAEYLRVESPSAEVQGHAPHEKQIIPGKRHVRISALEPVGNYAVRIVFDDGHNTGLFTWNALHQYGREQEERFSAYLAALEKKGLSRG